MKKYLPSLAWMMVIFFLSSRSTTGIFSDDQFFRLIIFKSLHLIEYAILSSLLFLASRKIDRTVAITYLYAITDELHQFFVPGRTCQFSDTIFDLIGIIIGLFVVKKVIRLFHF